MSVHHLYARARYGEERFTVQDLGVGPRLYVAIFEPNIGGWNLVKAVPIDPATFIRDDGAELHPLLVEALQRSAVEGQRVVPIKQAQGRLAAILATITA